MSFLKKFFNSKKNLASVVYPEASRYDVKRISETALFRMTVEDVSPISGGNSLVTGKIEKGTIKKGDSVKIVSSYDISDLNVAGISISKEFVDEAAAGDKVGLFLRNIKNKSSVENKRVEIGCLLVKGYNGSLGA